MDNNLLLIIPFVVYIIFLKISVKHWQNFFKFFKKEDPAISDTSFLLAFFVPLILYTSCCYFLPYLGKAFVASILFKINWGWVSYNLPLFYKMIFFVVKNNQENYWMFPLLYCFILHQLLFFSWIQRRTGFWKEFFSNLIYFVLILCLILLLHTLELVFHFVIFWLCQDLDLLYFFYTYNINPEVVAALIIVFVLYIFLSCFVFFLSFFPD